MPPGRVPQLLITTRQIIADAVTKYIITIVLSSIYIITMCAQVLQYHPSSNYNHRSVIWKLIYLAHREIPDPAYERYHPSSNYNHRSVIWKLIYLAHREIPNPAYALIQYFQTNKATSDLRTKLSYRPQDIYFYYFADAKPTVIWFKSFAARYLSTTQSRFRRIPTYAPCNPSHTSNLPTYVATITPILEYHLWSSAPYGTVFDNNTGALETPRLPKMRTSTTCTATPVAPHHSLKLVCDRLISIYPASTCTDDRLADVVYKHITQINVVRQRLQGSFLSFIHTAFVRECEITYVYPSRVNGFSLKDIISIKWSPVCLF